MGLNIQELMEDAERLEATPGQSPAFLANFVRIPDGNCTMVMRFLPPAQGKKLYVSTRIHRLGNRNFHCPRELDGKYYKGDCIVCEYYNDLWQQSKEKSCLDPEELQKQARSIKPIERYYYNVIVRQMVNEKGEMEKNVGPLIYSGGKTILKMLIRAITGSPEIQEPALGDITDIKTGRDFKLVKTMQGQGKDSYPQYYSSKFLDPSPLGTPSEVEKWLAEMHDLQSLRILKPKEELKHGLKVYLGLEKDKDSSFDRSEFQTGAIKTSCVETTSVPNVVANITSPETSEILDEEIIAELQALKDK